MHEQLAHDRRKTTEKEQITMEEYMDIQIKTLAEKVYEINLRYGTNLSMLLTGNAVSIKNGDKYVGGVINLHEPESASMFIDATIKLLDSLAEKWGESVW